MPAILYHVPRTVSSPIVQILLELELVNNPIVVKEMSFPELKTKEHLAINPMGSSPTFQDTDLGITMWESGAVLDYLLERYDMQNQVHPAPTDETSSPETILARAKYLQLKQYIIATVYPFIASMYIHLLKPKADQDEEYMEAAKHKWQTVLGPVLTEWLGEGPYFLGEQISAVGFLLAKPLTNVNAMGLLKGFPSLMAVFERVSSRPTYNLAYVGMGDKLMALPNHQSIVLIPNKQNGGKPNSPKKRFTWSLRRPTAAAEDPYVQPQTYLTTLNAYVPEQHPELDS